MIEAITKTNVIINVALWYIILENKHTEQKKFVLIYLIFGLFILKVTCPSI